MYLCICVCFIYLYSNCGTQSEIWIANHWARFLHCCRRLEIPLFCLVFSILSQSILYYSILLFSILFYSILFYYVLLRSIMLYYVLFYHVILCQVIIYTIVLHHYIIFCYILLTLFYLVWSYHHFYNCFDSFQFASPHPIHLYDFILVIYFVLLYSSLCFALFRIR